MAAPILHRVAAFDTPPVRFTLDGQTITARAGESLLAAILTHTDHLRRHEQTGEKRAGFCLMGACQDCWVEVVGRGRVRACTTPAEPGMEVRRG